jgi:hypothetical protein
LNFLIRRTLLPEAIHFWIVFTSIVFGYFFRYRLDYLMTTSFLVFFPITFETRQSLSSFSRVERINGGGTRRLFQPSSAVHPFSSFFSLSLSSPLG